MRVNPAHPSSRRAALLALLVSALAFAGMARVCANDFVAWDDSFTLYGNARMNPPTAATLRFYWTRTEHGLYIPATQTVWSALARIARTDRPDPMGVWLDPTVFHVASVMLHATAALVMFLLLRRLLGTQRSCDVDADGAGGSMRSDSAAAIGALVFALHPVQVESVAWAAGMKDVLYGLFSLVALWQYVVAVQSSSTAARRRVLLHFALATAAFVWAVLCKPTAMVVPALAVVIHVVVLRQSWRDAAKWTAAWWAITLAAMVVARLAQQVGEEIAAPLWLRPLVAGDALAFYAGKILLPLKLCIDYGRSPSVAQSGGWIYLTWLVPVALAALLIWRPRREFVAAALLTTICVAPVLGLATFMFQAYSTVADHYLYLAMLGPALAVAWLAAGDWKWTRPIALVALALLATKTFGQAGTWRDSESLFTHTLAVNANSFVSCNNLGGSYDALGDALATAAHRAEAANDRVAAQSYRRAADDNYQRAHALYTAAIEKRKAVHGGVDTYLPTRALLARACSKLRNHEEAAGHWLAAADIIKTRRPQIARRELPNLYCLAAQEMLAANRPQDALRHLDQAREVDPAHVAVAQTRKTAQRMLAAMPID